MTRTEFFSRLLLMLLMSCTPVLAAHARASTRPALAGTAVGTPARVVLNACTLGELNPPTTTLNTMDLTDLVVYQLLDPAGCTACAGAPLVLNQVAWRFKYYLAPCPLTLEVSVVGTDQAACPHPVDTQVICPSFTFVYTPTGDPSPVVTIPMPAGCCISAQAFVRVRIVNTGGCGTGTLAFFARGPCSAPCRSYASSPLFPLDDSCNALGMSPTITVGADCCGATPGGRPTWGGLKTHYR